MRNSQNPSHWHVRNPLDLGAIIRQRRELAGLTLDEAAGLLGIGRRFLIELEHGKRRASIDRVMTVLHGLGLELIVEVRKLGHRPSPPTQEG